MNQEQALAPQSAAESQVEKAPEKVVVSIPQIELTPEELTKLEKFLSELTGAEVNTTDKSEVEERKTESTPKVMSALALAEQAANDPHANESQEPLAVRAKRGLLKKQEAQLASMSAAELAESGETIRAQIAELRKELASHDAKSNDPNVIDVEAKVIPESGETLQIGYEKTDKNEPPILTDALPIPTLTDKVGDARGMQVAQLQRDLGSETNLKSSYEAAIDRMGATEDISSEAEKKEVEAEPKTDASQEKSTENKPEGAVVTVAEGVSLSQERRLATLEQISRAQELQTARLKGNLLERGLSRLEKSSTLEAYRNMNWKKKVALGVLMGTAGAAAMGTGAAPAALAAGLAFRGLGMASVYTGFIERTKIKKNEGASTIIIDTNGETVVEITNNDRLKALGLTALVGLLLPQAIKEGLVTVAETEVGQNVIGYAGDKLTSLGEKISSLKTIFGEKPAAPLVSSPEEIIPAIDTPSVPAVAATPEVAAAIAGKALATEIKAGDTAYSVLRRMVPDIDKLDGATRQSNAIENILAKMKAHPGGLAAFGISSGNINELKPGESIDVTKIQSILDTAKMSSGKGILEHAASLSEDTVRRIAAFSQPGAVAAPAAETGVGPLGQEDTVTRYPDSALPDTTHAEDGGTLQAQSARPGAAVPADALPADNASTAAATNGVEQGAVAATPATPAPLAEGVPANTVAVAPLPEAAIPTPTRLPEAPLPTAATGHSFNLSPIQMQALNAKQDEMILNAFYKTGTLRENQGLIRNIFTGLFGTGNGAGAGRQAVEQIGTRIGQSAMSAQELAAAKAEWLKVKDIPASQIMSSNTPGPLNALKTKLENLSMGVLPQPQAGQSFDSYMRNILANSIKQGRSINV